MASLNENALRTVLQRLRQRTETSRRYRENHHEVLADSRGSVGYRAAFRDAFYPIVGSKASGAHIWDLDGNDYVDLAMGFGVQLFGHDAVFIKEAIVAELNNGLHLGPQSRLAGEVAELICDLTGVQRLCFCNTGTEAVMTSFRLARAATGRRKIAMFKWSYHGHFDGTLGRPPGGKPSEITIPLAPGIAPRFVEDLVMLDYGVPSAFSILDQHWSDLAAVIVEPVQSLRPEMQPREFLMELARRTSAHGTVLIFDEILVGFRIHPGGAQAHFGVAADLVTYGKIIGGGLPIGVVAGRPELMRAIDGGPWVLDGNDSPAPQRTFFAGTFNKNPLTMAASLAVLRRLQEKGPGLQSRLNQRTADLAETLNAWFLRQEIPLRIHYFGSFFRFSGRGDQELCYGLLARGVYVWEGRSCFLSTAHSDEDIACIVDAVKAAATELYAISV